MPPAMPPTSGSRAGLITALVSSIIVAVAMIVVSIYGFQKWNESDRALQDLHERYKPFVSDADITDPRVLALNSPQTKQAYAGLQTALQVSIAQSDQLAKLVGGSGSPEAAMQTARETLKSATTTINGAKKQLNFTLPADTLAAAVSALADKVVQLSSAKEQVQAQLAASEQSKQQLIVAQKAELDAKDKLIADANAKVDQANAEAKTAQDQATAAQAALQASANTTLKQVQDTNAALSTQIQTKDKQILAAQKLLAGFKTKLHLARVNPDEAVIQHADGNILRVTDYNTCFINLGSRQHVTKGLTFEVYDQAKGIPPLGDGLSDTGMPVGKASIEVFSVGPDTSECRIIKVQPGQQIVIGDLISNLIYDPNIAYNFVVYGDFDLSGSGIPSPTDAEVIKRLIKQWGAKIQDHVTPDTDFIVMGAEPVVPAVTDQNDAGQVLRHQRALDQQKNYQAVIASAEELSVPIMNQNRFLYFTGYYDQANR